MQLARNLFLNRRKTLARKLEEIVLAWLLEQEFDKDELMAIYVNLVEFGPDLYGIQEAARHYFDKDPAQLTPSEVAGSSAFSQDHVSFIRCFRRDD